MDPRPGPARTAASAPLALPACGAAWGRGEFMVAGAVWGGGGWRACGPGRQVMRALPAASGPEGGPADRRDSLLVYMKREETCTLGPARGRD